MKKILLIPEKRINIVKDRDTKEKIEKELKIKLTFIENSVEIEGDGLEVYIATNIVKAIGRGFSPENAFMLLDENENLEIIDLNYNENKLRVIKARLIGSVGKTKKLIEECSGCKVSIYGKTVSLIGKYSQLQVARESIRMVLYGSKLSTVYGFLRKAK